MTERFYDLWDEKGNHVGRIKCEKHTLESIVNNSDVIADSSTAEVEPVSIEVEDHHGNTMLHFQMDINQVIQQVKGGSIADITNDYLSGSENKMYRIQNEKDKGVK